MLVWLMGVDNVGHNNVPNFAEEYAAMPVPRDGHVRNLYDHPVRPVEVKRERLISVGG